jgi:hypothetical protein
MAPERFEGRDSGRASDVYSLGVVLYRLVSHRFPIEAKDHAELSAKQRRGERVPLRDVRPELPQAFVQVIERALHPDPEQRYSTMGQMEQALAAARGITVLPDRPSRLRMTLDTPWFKATVALSIALAAGIYLVNVPGRALRVETSLYRLGDGIEERLLPGAAIAPGDQLFLEVESAEAINLYVLNEDEIGEAWVLFPLPSLDLANPLPAATRHRLPGPAAGTDRFWSVTSAGGAERFLVIASREPLPEFEQAIAGVPLAGSGAPSGEGTQSAQRLRGVGGLSDPSGPADGDAGSSISGIVRGLKGKAADTSGIVVWEIELRNPGSR